MDIKYLEVEIIATKNHNLKPSPSKIWLASPTMHDPELEHVKEAYETNWMSTVGNIGILGTCR